MPMLAPTITQAAEEFRKTWSDRFAKHPSLIPDRTWSSFSVLDALCYYFRYRKNWTEPERTFLKGAAANLTEVTYDCWSTFCKEFEFTDTGKGFEASATYRKGLFSGKGSYKLPIEQNIYNILTEPPNPFPALGQQMVVASDATPFLSIYGLGACLGMSPHGEGDWAKKLPGDLKDHIDSAVPAMAASSAAYFARVYGVAPEAGSDPEFYSHQLIWPPVGYHGDYCSSMGADGIAQYEQKKNRSLTTDELVRLLKLPDQTVSSAAAVHIITRLDEEFPREVAEILHFKLMSNAGGYRQVAIELSKKRKKEIDWLETQDSKRFDLERRFGILPLLYLGFEDSMKPAYRDLINTLVAMDIPKANEILKHWTNWSAELLFQKAMLLKVQGKNYDAEVVFQQIERQHPHFEDPRFLNEFGMNCIKLNKFDKAIELLKRGTTRFPQDGALLGNLGWAYMCNKDYQSALDAITKAIDYGDFWVTYVLNRATILDEYGEKEYAKRDREFAITLIPFDRRCISNAMVPFFESGDTKRLRLAR
jgi:tetratricopeptide (TPR) repeat protein